MAMRSLNILLLVLLALTPMLHLSSALEDSQSRRSLKQYAPGPSSGYAHGPASAQGPAQYGQCSTNSDCGAYKFCEWGTCTYLPGYCEDKNHCKDGWSCKNHFCKAPKGLKKLLKKTSG